MLVIRNGEKTNLALRTGEANVVSSVYLSFVHNDCEQIVLVQHRWPQTSMKYWSHISQLDG